MPKNLLALENKGFGQITENHKSFQKITGKHIHKQNTPTRILIIQKIQQKPTPNHIKTPLAIYKKAN
jgi:hypothetical protein